MKAAVTSACILAVVAGPTVATAQVRDATYRGTMVCDKLPFTETKMRDAIAVTVTGKSIRYEHVVRLGATPERTSEQGTGVLNGQSLTLQGAWESPGRAYKATYAGVFVRRSVRLQGTQNWTIGGKTLTRACSATVKRPFRVFLPRQT